MDVTGGGIRRCWVVIMAAAVAAWAGADPTPSSSPADVRGAVIPVDTDISDVTTDSLKRRVKLARDGGATVIILELNTPGGMVTSALDICDFIKRQTDVKTVAWVNSQAFSAGSMIAVACDEIVMSSRSTIGDCGVIMGSPVGAQPVPEELRAKAEAPVLTEFRESANRRGYSRLLCEAMVIKEREAWWVENVETDERRFVDTKKKNELLGLDEDGEQEESDVSREPVAWRLVEDYYDPVAEAQVDLDNPIISANKLLTMTQSEACAFGFAKAIVSNESGLRARYNLTELPRITFTRLERFTGWMTSMPVRMFLLIIVLLGAYVEFNTPGVGVPGLVALIALAIFVAAPYMTGLANAWEIVVILIGVALLAVEIFVIPGFGVAGVLGILCIVVGFLATFVPEEPGRGFPIYWPSLDQSFEGLKAGLLTLAAGLGGAFFGAFLIGKYLPQIPLLNLAAPASPTPATVAVEDPYRGAAQIGDIGIAASPLRPSGRARFGATLVDVVTEGDFLDSGVEVEVIERRGNHVVVRRVPS